jgi:uncharacterized alpha/beta hydrolase family protein
MFRYYFDDDITVESVNNLVDKLQNKEGEIELYFSTNGGSPSAMNFLINSLNSRKEEITVVVTDACYSAGADIFVYFEGKIRTEYLDCIIFHLLDRPQYAFRKDSYSWDKEILKKQDKQFNIDFAEKIKERNLLTERQLKQLLNGKDVVVYQDQYKKWKLN